MAAQFVRIFYNFMFGMLSCGGDGGGYRGSADFFIQRKD